MSNYEVNYASFYKDQELNSGLIFRTSNLDIALKKMFETAKRLDCYTRVFRGEIKKSTLENSVNHYGIFVYTGYIKDTEIKIYLKEYKS